METLGHGLTPAGLHKEGCLQDPALTKRMRFICLEAALCSLWVRTTLSVT